MYIYLLYNVPSKAICHVAYFLILAALVVKGGLKLKCLVMKLVHHHVIAKWVTIDILKVIQDTWKFIGCKSVLIQHRHRPFA